MPAKKNTLSVESAKAAPPSPKVENEVCEQFSGILTTLSGLGHRLRCCRIRFVN